MDLLLVRPAHGGNPCTGGDPAVVAFEFEAELFVEDPQVPVASSYHGAGQHALHFLRHHPNIGLVAAVIGKAIEAKTVVEHSQQDDVVLEVDIAATSAATSASAT